MKEYSQLWMDIRVTYNLDITKEDLLPEQISILYENLIKTTTTITAYIWHSRFNPDDSFLIKFDRRERHEDSELPFYQEIREVNEQIHDDDWNAKLMKGD